MDLYKYRYWTGLDGDRTRECLKRSAVYLAPSISFNDPFDFFPAIVVNQNYRDIKLSMTRGLQDIHGLSKTKAKRLARRHWLENPRVNTHEARYRSAIEAMDKMRKTQGICCLTSKPDNPAMWAHYGENHQGICVHYDIKEFFPVRLPTGARTDLPVILRNVNYTETRPVVDVFKPNYAAGLFESLLIKSSDWSYEHEYRILSYDYIGLAYYKPDCLKRIIVGYKMPEKTIEEVREFIKTLPSLPILCLATPNDTKFSYDIVPF